MADLRRFHPADYVIFVLTLVISAAIGIFYAWKDKKRQNTSEFLLGGRNMSILPVTLSLMASFLSAVLVLGVPTEIFYHGTMYWLISFSNILTFPIAAHAFLPVFHRLELTSAYEYLELRFNKTIRIIGCCVFQLQMILYMAVVLYAPALALNQVMGINIYISILVIGLVCTFYTAIGGLKAVMWTDAFQMVIVFVGLLTLVIKTTLEEGGFQNIWDKSLKAGKLQADNFDPNPLVRHTFWTLVIGGCMTSLTIYASNQAMIQRYLSMGTVKRAQTALYLQLPASLFFTSILVYAGLVLFAKYGEADPVGCTLQRKDQLIPWLVMDVLGTYYGLPGLMVACFFSASLSTVSSGVNALALVMITDIVKPIYKKITLRDMMDVKATVYSKLIAIIYGFLTIGLAFAAKYMGSFILQIALSIFGMVGGPVLGVFILAMFFPTANSWGAGFGLVVSLGVSFWAVIGSIAKRGTPPPPSCHLVNGTIDNITTTLSTAISTTVTTILQENSTDTDSTATKNGLDKFYSLSYMWYSTLAVVVVVVVGLLVSCFTGGTRKKPVDRRLLSPLYNAISSLSATVNVMRGEADNSDGKIDRPATRKRNTNSSHNGNVQEIIIEEEKNNCKRIITQYDTEQEDKF